MRWTAQWTPRCAIRRTTKLTARPWAETNLKHTDSMATMTASKTPSATAVDRAAPCSEFLLRGWARAWSDIAFGNYLESLDRSRLGYEWRGESYRRIWKQAQMRARQGLGRAAERCGATLKFGPFNSVEINIPNADFRDPAK